MFKNQPLLKYVLLVPKHCDYLLITKQHFYENLPSYIKYLE